MGREQEGREPMGEQIEAHERFLEVARRMRSAQAYSEDSEARRLAPDYEREKRRWRKLVREATDALRHKRPRP